jgi:hypothetical protein
MVLSPLELRICLLSSPLEVAHLSLGHFKLGFELCVCCGCNLDLSFPIPAKSN